MITRCAICGEYCPNYMSYQMHRELFHIVNTIQKHRGRFLTKEEKQEIVHRGERRIGLKHFIS